MIHNNQPLHIRRSGILKPSAERRPFGAGASLVPWYASPGTQNQRTKSGLWQTKNLKNICQKLLLFLIFFKAIKNHEIFSSSIMELVATALFRFVINDQRLSLYQRYVRTPEGDAKWHASKAGKHTGIHLQGALGYSKWNIAIVSLVGFKANAK